MPTNAHPNFDKRAVDLRHVLLLSSRYKPGAQDVAREATEWLEEADIPFSADLEGESDLTDLVREETDLVISVGGDGTILHAARRLASLGSIPTFGVNIGKLGFLAEFSKQELQMYLQGRDSGFRIIPRMMLACEVRKGDRVESSYALNDAVVSQGVRTHVITVDLSVDEAHATQYRADGVVCSTPVGSTAYSLSLGGPILTPGLRAFVVTPVAPHALTNRPIVIEGTATLKFQVQSRVEELALIIDGHETIWIDTKSEISIRQAEKDFHLLSRRNRSYYQILKKKLHWGRNPKG